MVECDKLSDSLSQRLTEIKTLKDQNQKLMIEIEKLKMVQEDNEKLNQNLTQALKEFDDLRLVNQ